MLVWLRLSSRRDYPLYRNRYARHLRCLRYHAGPTHAAAFVIVVRCGDEKSPSVVVH